jgi:shikimate dehydrogenase
MITAKTKITGLFGWPVEHSLSPWMHNAGFTRLGLDYRYAAFPVRPELLKDAVNGIRGMGLAGVNVTVPHKERVMEFLDEIDPEARFIGAVNTVVNREGRLTGCNTDGRGFMRSLEEAGVSAAGRKILIIGAGGASRAVGYYLAKEASALSIFDIDRPKLKKLVMDLKSVNAGVKAARDLGGAGGFDIVINATPLGLKAGDPLPVDTSGFGGETVACDLIYKDTPFLAGARKKGCLTVNGLGMLFWQGVLAFELWTGQKAPVEEMRGALLDAFERASKG